MTPDAGITHRKTPVNWRNFHIAARLAEKHGVTDAMITGKGEPTLYPAQITAYLTALEEHDIPLVDLNTNGLLFMERPEEYDAHLREWHKHGLTTVAISIAHYDAERNREIYCPKKRYMDLPGAIAKLHGHGFSVRLSCTMVKGYIDSPSELERLIGFAREHKADQLTVRPVAMPEHGGDERVTAYTREHLLTMEQRHSLEEHLDAEGTLLQKTAYGAKIYDVDGQNVCMTNCLTLPVDENVRQLIFFPDGHVRYDWQHEGAVIL
jgi:molybdenum cofactor biosynthesis enzyme MoaA